MAGGCWQLLCGRWKVIDRVSRKVFTYGELIEDASKLELQLPPPLKSFLHQHDFKGKTIIPFNTDAGYGIGSSFQTVRELCKDSKILKGFEVKGGIEKGWDFVCNGREREKQAQTGVKTWVQKIGLLNKIEAPYYNKQS